MSDFSCADWSKAVVDESTIDYGRKWRDGGTMSFFSFFRAIFRETWAEVTLKTVYKKQMDNSVSWFHLSFEHFEVICTVDKYLRKLFSICWLDNCLNHYKRVFWGSNVLMMQLTILPRSTLCGREACLHTEVVCVCSLLTTLLTKRRQANNVSVVVTLNDKSQNNVFREKLWQ